MTDQMLHYLGPDRWIFIESQITYLQRWCFSTAFNTHSPCMSSLMNDHNPVTFLFLAHICNSCRSRGQSITLLSLNVNPLLQWWQSIFFLSPPYKHWLQCLTLREESVKRFLLNSLLTHLQSQCITMFTFINHQHIAPHLFTVCWGGG